jgi:serine/threonine protein kinase
MAPPEHRPLESLSYHLDPEPLARGGQGEVRVGRRSDGKAVAVKVAAPEKTSKEALRHEISVLRALAAAGVPNLVEVLDEIEVGGRPAMVMPRYARTLRDWLDAVVERPDADSLVTALRHCATVARSLSALHRVEVDGGALVHRDVKPENVLIDDDGILHLGDFGGALAIDGLAAVEMGLFGTPMWAPFDQILPGLAMPDPTWDTYALCVLLYACVTGARPAYQADPRELLSPRGRRLWETARAAISADPNQARTLRAEFAAERQGTRAEDIVDLTGRSALNDADRRAIHTGVERLGALAGLDGDRADRLKRGLWAVLVRGLSPVSHPSPPNRYRDAGELADALDDLLRVADDGRPSRHWLDGPMSGPPDLDVDLEPREPVLRSAPPFLPIVGLVVALVGVAVVASAVLGRWSRPPDPVEVVATTVDLDGLQVRVPAFRLDRTEVTRDEWMGCVDAGACPLPLTSGAPGDAVTGVSFAEALAFCTFAGGRLPSEVEWKAAAGPSVFPWGDAAPTCAHAVALGCRDAAGPPDTAPDGVSSSGAADLAGNAWEWVRVGKGGDRGVLLGGSFRTPASEIGARGRLIPASDARPDDAGLRCAY